jgi:UDP-N-acetylmuramate dehydrogenase
MIAGEVMWMGTPEEPWMTELKAVLGPNAEFSVPMNRRVSFKIGGPADAFVRPESVSQLLSAVEIAAKHRIPWLLVGTGSNLLVSDVGIRGMVIRPWGKLREVECLDEESSTIRLRVGAGALNADVVRQCHEWSACGLEFLGTIPGTFGGALWMNAGAHGHEIGEFVECVELVTPSFNVEHRSIADCAFRYRDGGFVEGELLTGAILRVPRGDVVEAKARLQAQRKKRKATQPTGFPNAGSIFKNPPGDYAGRLIETVGLKGRQVGGARISDVHANFIVNVGGASASDVVKLAECAQQFVRDRFQIDLEWEVKRVGIWK